MKSPLIRRARTLEPAASAGDSGTSGAAAIAAVVAFLVLVLGAPAPLAAQITDEASIEDPGPEHHLTFTSEDIDWQPGPGSLEPGAEFAVLEGNPAEAGVFTLRIRMPDGYRISPHWHPNVERVTVVSGTFRLGTGDDFDAAATTPLRAGSYTSMPPGMRHFAVTEGETVIQLTSVGPWVINYVNPDDDPRTRD